MVRLSAGWMVLWDDRILEILYEDDPATATQLSKKDEIRVSRAHISNRLSKLSDNKMIEEIGNGVYRISKKGIGYLAGQYDVENDDWRDLDEDEINADTLSVAEISTSEGKVTDVRMNSDTTDEGTLIHTNPFPENTPDENTEED